MVSNDRVVLSKQVLESLFEKICKIVSLVACIVYNCGMGGSSNFPAGREDFSTTVSVAEQLDALMLPSVRPVSVGVDGLVGLPDFPAPGVGVEERFSCRLFGVRALMDDCVEALAVLGRHQNRCAALVAMLVELSLIHI